MNHQELANKIKEAYPEIGREPKNGKQIAKIKYGLNRLKNNPEFENLLLVDITMAFCLIFSEGD